MAGAGDFSDGAGRWCECCRGGADVGAGNADTSACEDDGLGWDGIGRSIDNGSGIDTGVNAGVRNWRSIGFVIDIAVSIGRDAGVGADDGCDWVGIGVGRIWACAGFGIWCGAECRRRD